MAGHSKWANIQRRASALARKHAARAGGPRPRRLRERALRGLRAGRRGGDGGVRDGGSRPRASRGAPRLRAARRQARRGRLGELPVQYRGTHDLPARHGRGRSSCRWRSRPAPRTWCRAPITSVEVLADPLEFDTVCAVLTHRGFTPATRRSDAACRHLARALRARRPSAMVHLLDGARGAGRGTGRVFECRDIGRGPGARLIRRRPPPRVSRGAQRCAFSASTPARGAPGSA